MNAPNVPDFRPAEETIGWAKEEIADFTARVSAYFANRHSTMIREHDAKTGGDWFILRFAERIDLNVFKKPTVQALLHIRHSFDQATNIAGSYISGKRFKKNFPWADRPRDLEDHRLTEFPQQLWGPIKSQEPYPRGDSYPGGNNLVRALACLANNKHSVGFVIDALGGMAADALVIEPGVKRVAIMAPNWNPVKQEIRLCLVAGGRIELKGDAHFGLSICLEVPKLPNPPEIGFALREFLAATERNLELMKTACGK